MTDFDYSIDRDTMHELHELLEDIVSLYCNENMISGELAWLIVQCYSLAKIEQFKGNVK